MCFRFHVVTLQYHQVSNISRTKSQHKILIVSWGCLCRIPWSQMLSREWRCSWSSADRRCSNYIWVIDNFIAYWGATYIRGFYDILMQRFTIVYFAIFFRAALIGNKAVMLLSKCQWSYPERYRQNTQFSQNITRSRPYITFILRTVCWIEGIIW